MMDIVKSRCRLCSASYDAGRHRCPMCGTENHLVFPGRYVVLEVEIERELHNALLRIAGERGPMIDIVTLAVEALKQFVGYENTGKRR